MASLYVATELSADLQSLGFLRHGGEEAAKRAAALKKVLGAPIPRVGAWTIRKSIEHGLAKAELTGWILAGHHPPEPAGLPTACRGDQVGPDALPSAYFGGLLRLGQTQNGAYWGADIHKKAMPVYVFDPRPEGIRHGWRRRFDRLDDFVFYAAKSALCQRDRITTEEFLDLARERGVRPEELVPDSLEDERAELARLGLRRCKKVASIADRFVFLDVLIGGLLPRPATVEEVARFWVNILGLQKLREDHDDLTNPSVQAFWLLRHAIFGDQTGYARVMAKAGKKTTGIVVAADTLARKLWDKKHAPFDRAGLARAIEARSSR